MERSTIIDIMMSIRLAKSKPVSPPISLSKVYPESSSLVGTIDNVGFLAEFLGAVLERGAAPFCFLFILLGFGGILVM